jgi:hypothetical protein
VVVFQREVKLVPSPQILLTSETNVLIITGLRVSTLKRPSEGHTLFYRTNNYVFVT